MTIPLLGIYLREVKIYVRLLISTLFWGKTNHLETIQMAVIWEWVDKPRYTRLLHRAPRGHLQGVTLAGQSQAQRLHTGIPFLGHSGKGKTTGEGFCRDSG